MQIIKNIMFTELKNSIIKKRRIQMLNNKIKYILALFIILSLSMNAFSATDFTNDSDVALQSSDSVDEVAADAAGEVADDSENNQGDDTQTNGEGDSAGDSSSTGTGTGASAISKYTSHSFLTILTANELSIIHSPLTYLRVF